MATKTEGYIKELKRLGFTPAATASRKFLSFQHPEMHSLLFVGRRGNIRIGRTVSGSLGIYRPDQLLNHLQQKFIEEVVKTFEAYSIKFCIFIAGVMAGYAWAWHHFS